ncbi:MULTISPECIES: hypothetical protein [unclassified Pseudoalteromonas]|uniref:hypothetical protein n=1 Tax=unclassified Pseudoalteromonas TaxID=194690 RepID=UPI0020971F8D|nr:hypothetical protein [Pseudoalteromonas sp. XMcav2-N]MCO7188525.1 hypothetical protein [Pseudoalteromonas sp. XMcav2-N]
MSYSLMFSIPGIPESDEDAWDEFDEREEANEENELAPHPLMQDLINQLTKRYPCICTLPDEEIDGGLWADGPIENNIVGDLLILAIVFSKVEEALPFIAETAKNVGVVFYDPQTEKIFRS